MAATCRRYAMNEESSIHFGKDIKWDSPKGRSCTIIYNLELGAQKSQFVNKSETSQSVEVSRQQVRDGEKGRYDAVTEDSGDYETSNLNLDYREWHRSLLHGQRRLDSLISQRKEARVPTLANLTFKPCTKLSHLARLETHDLEEDFVAAPNPEHCSIWQDEHFWDGPYEEFCEKCRDLGGNMKVSNPTSQLYSAGPSNFNLYRGDSSRSNREVRLPRKLFPAYERDIVMWDPSLPARPQRMLDYGVIEAISPQEAFAKPMRQPGLSFPVPQEESQPFFNEHFEMSHIKSCVQGHKEIDDNELDNAWERIWAPVTEEYRHGLYAIKYLQEDNQNEWDCNGEDKLNRSISSWLQAIAEPNALEMAVIEPLQEYEDNAFPLEYEESEELKQFKNFVIEGKESLD